MKSCTFFFVGFCSLLLISCKDIRTDFEEIRNIQMKSDYGPTDKWNNYPSRFKANIQNMRDIAYRFCIKRHRGDDLCISQQDYSLLTAVRVDGFFEKNYREGIVPSVTVSHRPGEWIAVDRKLYENAVKYCLAVYDDGLEGDARSLGPCLTSAVGGDFFGIIERP